jgi:hypothetical protein
MRLGAGRIFHGGFGMKYGKLAAVMAFFFVYIVSVEAQVTFGSWGRVVVTPLAFTSDDDGIHSAVSAATFTSSDTPSIGFTANGIAPSGKIGFKIDLGFGGGRAGIGDNAKVWIKPFEVFTLTAGLFKEEELRGKIGASEFAAWILPNSSKNEDYIFQRFDALAGAHFKINPIVWLDSPWNGLTIQGAFGSNVRGAAVNDIRAILNLFGNEDNDTISDLSVYDEDSVNYDGDRKMSALDVYKAMQIALGYRIPDVGLARFQFIGSNRDVFRWGDLTPNSRNLPVDEERKLVEGLNTNHNADIFEVAFLYDGIEGLKIDAGVKIPFEYKTKAAIVLYNQVIGTDGMVKSEIANKTNKEVTVQEPYVIAIGASWIPSALSALNITARADLSFGGKMEIPDDTEVGNSYIISGWLMPSYAVSSSFKVGLDTGVEIHGLDTLRIMGTPQDKAQTDASKYVDFGIGPWAELNIGGGRARMGLVMMLPGTPRYKRNSNSLTYSYSPQFRAAPVFSFPISVTYSF